MRVKKPHRDSRQRGASRTNRSSASGTVSLAIVLALALPVGVSAQYKQGDLIIASGASVSGPVLLNVAPGRPVAFLNTPTLTVWDMMTAPDNRSIWVTAQGPTIPAGVFDIAPDGTLTTISQRPMWLLGPDEEGGALCLYSSLTSCGLVRLRRSGAVTTVYWRSSFGYSAAGIDLTTGDLIMDMYNEIQRINLHGTSAQTTVASPVYTLLTDPMVHDPATDIMLGASFASLKALRVNGRFAAATIAYAQQSNYTGIGSIVIDPACRAAILPLRANYLPPPAPCWARVNVFDLSSLTMIGTILASSHSLPIDPCHVVCAHGRHLCGISPAARGNVYSALVSCPAEPGAPYVVGFSFGLRPGIRLPDGRLICLQPDPLFALSLTNQGPFSGCQGTLDPRGEAIARVAIPRVVNLAGLRVFAAAVTIANGRIRTISAPIGVTIQ